MPKKRTHEEFIDALNLVDPSIIVLGNYLNSTTRIEVQCKECGKIWSPIPKNLLAGKGCRECKIKQFADTRRKTHDQFLKELHEINPTVKVIGIYHSRHEKIAVQCLNCGYEWSSTPGDLLRGYGCKPCSIVRCTEARKIKHSDFVERISQINPIIKVISTYMGALSPVIVECINCGHKWETKAEYLLQGTGCPECSTRRNAENRRKTQKQYADELNAVHPDIKIVGEYMGDDKPIKVICKACH